MTRRQLRSPFRRPAVIGKLLLLFLLGLTSAGAVGIVTPSTSAATELTCERIPGLLNAFLHKHIRFRHMNDELRRRSIDSYVKRLDSGKTLFLASEEVELKKSLQGIFFDVGSGECGRLEEIQKDIITRYEKMAKFVEQYVNDESYAVDPSVELVIDPDKRAYPRNQKQQHALYIKLVHFQMSNYLSTGISLSEAKKKLVHRYELMVKRTKEFSTTDTYSLFLDAFASAMDPHSNYMNAEVEEDFKIQMGLSLIGIGVALSSRDGYSVVENIIPGGAADRVDRLRPKDKVIAVAQEEGGPVDVIDMDLRKVVRLIRGERGTTVHLTVLRQTPKTERFIVSIVRDHITLDEQAAKLSFEEFELNGQKQKLAIIDLPSFYGSRDPTERKCSSDVQKLLEEVNDAQAAGLLLDLSRNGGGLLDTARDIAGFFIREGGVVAVKDEFGNIQVLRDDDPEVLFSGPMVVLTSRISASASEIVAGAMKDYERAIIVGDDHTFGKGTVQTLVPLPPGLGALKVTTALFFRPGGESTQHSGVASDIVFPSLFNTNEIGEAHQTYSLESTRITPFLEDDSKFANASSTSAGHVSVTSEVIRELARRSNERVGANEEFTEIQKKLDESRERGGIIRLSEILRENDQREDSDESDSAESEERADESSEPNSEGADSDQDDDPDSHSIQRIEALEILKDYVRISIEEPGVLTAAEMNLQQNTP